jgi:outer membrane receptor protein involved in Fe transport
LKSPIGQTVITNGQQECFGSAFITFEQDKLYGSTFSFIHPFGNNLLDFTYDFHGESTFAVVACGTCVSVPNGTADRFSTFSATADLEPLKNISIKLGLYDTQWTVNGFKLADPANTTSTALTGLDKSISRFDPHFALTFHPTSSVSYRAAVGSSATFPFVGQVSGLATYQPPAQSLGPPFQNGGTLTEKNPNLLPEVNIAYGAGVDKRFGSASVLSLDLQQSVIHNVFETDTTSVPLNGGLEGIFFPVNAARLQTSLATLRYAYQPRVGFGFTGSVAANRSILSGVPLPVSGSQVPANGVQICGNGVAAPGIATCIPYLKGYGQLSYAAKGGAFLGLGVEYEGKNNSYFQPPFALVDFTFRKPVTKDVEMIVGVENLFNTNVYSNQSYLATPNSGTPIVADAANGSQTTFVPTLVPAIARTVRVQVRLHTGR